MSKDAGERLAVFLPNWIGDATMATPALRAIRRHLDPGVRVVGVLRPVIAELLEGTPWLDATIAFHPASSDPAERMGAVIARLRAERPRTALLLTHSFRTAWMAWRSGAARRIGFARHGRSLLLSDRLYAKRHQGRLVPAPVIDDYQALAARLGCPVDEPHRLELATSAADELAADRAWQRQGLGPREPVVLLNCGGAFGPAKQWPAEYFSALAFRIATQQRLPVVVLCGPSERALAREIAQAADHARVGSLADEPVSIGLTKACVRRARLLVTTDSGPRHFAAAFGVPVITLFGPTHIAWSETYYERAVHLQHAVPCGPCQQRDCPQGHHRCMRDLTVARVYQAVAAQLDQDPAARAA